MRRTGQSVCGHPHAAAVFSKRSRNASANGDPDGEDMMAAAFRLPSPGFGNQCNKVRRKEGSGQGWLVKTQVCLFKTDKLTQVRTLRHPETSTLSFVSAITLCIRSDCFSLTARAPESSLRLSLWTAVPRRLLSGLHANYCNQTQVILILHLTHLLTAVSWVFLPLQTSLNHAPLATVLFGGLKTGLQAHWCSIHEDDLWNHL